MSWAIGFDHRWNRDIGYGVPAWCDHPGCQETIDRGLSFVCGREPYGGEKGCGLYFCGRHHGGPNGLCRRCDKQKASFEAKPEHPEWIRFKLADESWQCWRDENPADVERLKRMAT